MSSRTKKLIFFSSLFIAAGCFVLPAAVPAAAEVPTMSMLGSIFGTATLAQIIIRLIQLILGLLGFIAVVLLIYAGFIWMTSQGDPKKVDKAKRMIYGVIIGLIIIFSAYAITAFLFSRFGPKPPPPPCDPATEICGPCDPATEPTRDCSTDGGRCAGLQTCDVTSHYWGSCLKTDPNCPGKQWAKIIGFKSDSMSPPWQIRFPSFTPSQPIAVPQVSDLNANSSAYNKGGSFSGATLWWGLLTAPFNYVSSSAFINVPAGAESFSDVFAPYEVMNQATGSVSRLKITAQPASGGPFDSPSLRTIIRPGHCFNGRMDSDLGETGRDCGGECGACPGSSCDSDTSNSVCDSDNSLCRFSSCDPVSCLCARVPSVYTVSPSKDVNGDDNQYQLDTYLDNIANGAPGNYITIWGRDFGNAAGEVYFRNRTSSALILAQLADDCPLPAACQKSTSTYWTNNQIIAKIPAGDQVDHTTETDITALTANYDVYVMTTDGLSSLNNASPDFASKLFEINKIDRPGVCSLCPNHGVYPTSTIISGNKFPTAGTQNIVWYFKAYDPATKIWLANNVTSTGTGWSASQVTTAVPENRHGLTSIRIFNGLQFSNYGKFLISSGNIGEPCSFDFSSCIPDNIICNAGSTCDIKTCTCQKIITDECVSGDTRACVIGGCPGTQLCGDNKKWTPGCDILLGSTCVPYLGSSATRSIFSWVFVATKYTGPGMSCRSDLWNDDTCEINGCVSANGRKDSSLFCDIKETGGEWLELFNANSVAYNLADWQLITEKPVSDNGLMFYYPLEIPADCSPAASTTACQPQNFAPGWPDYSPRLVGSGHWYDYQPCKFGRCISFNGSDTMLAIPASDAANATKGSFTWSAWYNPAASPADKDWAIINRGSAYQIILDYRWDSRFTFVVFSATNSRKKFNAESRFYPYLRDQNIWYHLAGVYDDNKKIIKIYVNGQLEDSVFLPADFNLSRHSEDPITVGGVIDSERDVYWADGLIDEVKLYTRVLSDAEVLALAGKNSYDLSGSAESGDYLRLDANNISGFALPQFEGRVSLVNDFGMTIDSIDYGPGAVTPAYNPSSFGRKRDGLDTDSKDDFIYYINATPVLPNTSQAAIGNKLVINEVSLSHGPCTCVQNNQVCKAGEIDKTSCDQIGVCAAQRVCDASGHFGECGVVPGCNPYPLRPGAESAVFTWGILAGRDNTSGPKVVIDCSRSATCNLDNALPSPTPWNSQWNKDNYPNLHINDPAACVNAVVSARFTEPMDANTLTTSSIRVFRYTNGATWEDVSSYFEASLINLGDSVADGFKIIHIVHTDTFVASTTYKVVLTSSIKDELGRRLAIDNQVNEILTAQDCYNSNVLSAGSLTAGDIKFCWNFTTRPNTDLCPVGCIDCNPDKYFNRYFSQEKNHEATPISEDNVCLMLNGKNYDWLWNEEQQSGDINNPNWQNPYPGETSGVPFRLSIYDFLTWPFSWVTDYLLELATTTAYRETDWRTYADNSSYFTDQDVDFFHIKSQEQSTLNSGYCRAHNNFTDPIVIENQYCTKSDDLNKQILQSPSPWKSQQDACINAAIFVLFSRNMLNSSLINTDNTVKNFKIYKCDDSANATSSDIATNDDCDPQSNWTAKVFNYNHQNITMAELIAAPASVSSSINPEGIEIFPPASLDINSWYKIVIKGGDEGVRGGTSTPEAAEGVLQVPSADAKMLNGTETWYYWYFKTGAAACPIDQVAVLPQLKFMPTVGEKQIYDADPYAANCNHLNPNSYIWKWDSLINSFVDRCAGTTPASGDYVATICDQGEVSCSSSAAPAIARVKAFSKSEGNTWITAAADQAGKTCEQRKWGAGDLQIGYGGFKVTDYSNTDCLNTEINLNFSQDAVSASINDNIRLYQCDTADCPVVSDSNRKDVDFLFPLGLPTDPNPAFTNHVYLKSAENLIAGTTYRVVVKGGENGLKSFVNSSLLGLNYSLDSGGGGEACDPEIYPWRVGDPHAGKCDSSCKLVGNLCGTSLQECSSTADLLFCDTNCHKTGNDNTLASCGNGKIEAGEECDDNNIIDGDSCSSHCLLEGSNSKYGSVCGNGRIQKGEQCDDGNAVSGDGCSNICLPESGRPSGSLPNAPICGNAKIEAGEECDDGAGNNKVGNRCEVDCLLSGGGGVCGNGKLENSQFDSYSWTFKLSDEAKVCAPIAYGVNPCPNGIWWLSAGRDVTKLQVRILTPSTTFDPSKCVKDADLNHYGFWRRALNLLVKIVTRFIGIRSALAVDYWCPISNETYSQSDLDNMAKGNFKKDIATTETPPSAIEVIGYTDETENYKINYLKSDDWPHNTIFKIVTNYERNGIYGTSSAEVLTFDRDCALDKIVFDVWPRGVRKTRDGFFCASDPKSGQPDDCGRYTGDLNDDDMSAPWTKDYPGNGYDLDDGGNVPVPASAPAIYQDGNQHLYRAWATAKQNSSWLLRADEFVFSWSHTDGALSVDSSFNSTFYRGDRWITSGKIPGKEVLTAEATDSKHDDISNNKAEGQEEIFTFFCNNPWPDPDNFPFVDDTVKNGLCTAGSGICINTNFGIYYCRDAGLEKTCGVKGDADLLGQLCQSNASCYKNPPTPVPEGICALYKDDDLPSITEKAPGVVLGSTGEECQNLPNNFSPTVGYYYSGSVDADYYYRSYLWNSAGIAYYRRPGGGWQKVDKGDWQKNGLPVNFIPVVGYGFKDYMYLWDAGGRYYAWAYDVGLNRHRWTATSTGNLPAGFRPKVGYVFGGKIALWDSSGNYRFSDINGTTWSDGKNSKTGLPANFKPIIGYYNTSNSKIGLWDKDSQEKFFVSSDGGNTWSTGIKTGLPPDFKPNFGFYNGVEAKSLLWQGNIVYQTNAFSWERYNLTDKLCDNKLKDFLFANIGGSADAIGIRVYNNNNHYSPTTWYQTRFNQSGSLTESIINDNRAVTQGNTIYVSAPDLSENAASVYTDIYLMSFNQGAGATTTNIFNQLVGNWYFNAGDSASGGLFYATALKTCSKDPYDSPDKCLTDAECAARGKGYCLSDKAKLSRDTIRLADLQLINSALSGYYRRTRCSNDFNRGCATNADCYGGGACGNFYPDLKAGTYIPGKTFSVWPSWQDNLAKALGVKLPIDPINAFATAIGPYCDLPHNPITCWNEQNKSMECDLANNSSVYVYYSNESGNKASVYALGEYNFPVYNVWRPPWKLVSGLVLNPFRIYYEQLIGGQFCQRILATCGNVDCEAAKGENCSTCPFDCGCTDSNKSCQKNVTWQCLPNDNSACGDGFKNVGEECDCGNNSDGKCVIDDHDYANDEIGGGCLGCKCRDGYDCSGAGGSPTTKCGDGLVVSGEECDFNAYGVPIDSLRHNLCADSSGKNVTYQGAKCCTTTCQKADWFINADTLRCGNGLRTDNEQCDCADNSAYPIINNPFTCPSINTNSIPANPGHVITDFCKTDCTRSSTLGFYCGDGKITGSEQCDSGTGCRPTDCQCDDANNFKSKSDLDCECKDNFSLNSYTGTCVPKSCGDGVVNITTPVTEECDSGLGCLSDCRCNADAGFFATDPLNKNCACAVGYKLQNNVCVCNADDDYSCYSGSEGNFAVTCDKLSATVKPAPDDYCTCDSVKNFDCIYTGLDIPASPGFDALNHGAIVPAEMCLTCGKSGESCNHWNDGKCLADCEDMTNDSSCGIRQGDVIGIKVEGTKSGSCNSVDFTYTNPYLSVNSDCSGTNYVNANRGTLELWEQFQVYFIDNDGNNFLSRGDQFKLITLNPNVDQANKVVRAGEDQFLTPFKNLRSVNANNQGPELFLTACDGVTGDCSSGPKSSPFINKGQKVCFLSTIQDKDSSDIWYGYLYDDTSESRHFPIWGEYFKNEETRAKGLVCNLHFFIDWP